MPFVCSVLIVNPVLLLFSLSQLPKMSMNDVMNTLPRPNQGRTFSFFFFFFLNCSGTGPYFSRVVTPDVWLSALVLVSPVQRVLWLVDCTVGYGGAIHCLLLRVLCKIHTQATCMSSSTEAAPSMMTIKGLVCRKKTIDLYIKEKKNKDDISLPLYMSGVFFFQFVN